jgi:hypothetical protein
MVTNRGDVEIVFAQDLKELLADMGRAFIGIA